LFSAGLVVVVVIFFVILLGFFCARFFLECAKI